MTIVQRSAAAGLLLAAFAGCEPGPPNVTPGPETPHGGSLFPMPDGQGYVEIVKQAVPSKKGHSQFVAYFLGSDRKPLATPPTAVSFKLAGGTAPIELKPTSDADPAKAGGLATSLVPDRDGLSGDLSATIDGKPVTVPIGSR